MFGYSGLNSTECVFTNSFSKEIGLALQRDHFHLFKEDGDVEQFRLMQAHKEMVSYKLNELGHLIGIHANQSHEQSLVDEISLDFHSASNDARNCHWGNRVKEMFVVDVDSKVTVEAFIMRDEFVGEGKSRKKAAFLEPKDGTEGAREEDPFDGSKCKEVFSKCPSFHVGLVVHPVNLALDARTVVDSVKEAVLFSLILHNGGEEIGIGFSTDGFNVCLNDKEHFNVKGINFCAKLFHQVVHDN